MVKILIIILIALQLCGCRSPEKNYDFRQSTDNISKIEILCNSDNTHYLDDYACVKTLEGEEIQPFVNAILELTCRQVHYEPLAYWDVYVFKVFYTDGNIEYVAGGENIYYLIDGSKNYRYHTFDRDEFNEAVAQFVGQN